MNRLVNRIKNKKIKAAVGRYLNDEAPVAA